MIINWIKGAIKAAPTAINNPAREISINLATKGYSVFFYIYNNIA